MKELIGAYIIWYRDILRFWHDKTRMIGAVTFPLLFLVVFGSGLSARMGTFAPGVDFTRFMFPGVIGMTVLMTSFSAGVGVVWDREFGFLKEVLVAPISRVTVALGKALGSATIAMVQGVVILLFAPLLGIKLSAGTVLELLALMFLLAISMGSMGILLATRIRSMEAFQAVMQMLLFPMVFLSGVFFAVAELPGWMSLLVKVNPATYGVTPLRQVMLGDMAGAFNIEVLGRVMSIWDSVSVMAVFGAAMILLAMWSFGHQE
ncbi:MAG: ABC transporter permease [Chloroflexi bacterium]|nr:ABC transporter permease [Chloroflexota bacterium]